MGIDVAQYTKNIHELGYVVTVLYVDPDASTKRVKWVDRNVSGKYFRDLVDVENGNVTYYFEDKQDAIAFKMVWG